MIIPSLLIAKSKILLVCSLLLFASQLGFSCKPASSASVILLTLHPKLRDINLHNVTHSLISPNPRERIFIVQISLHIFIFLSLISRNLSITQTTKEVNPRPHIAPRVNMWSVAFLLLFLFFIFFCHLLNVGACVCHIAPGKAMEWTTLA
jgi:hypothetical protein